MSTEPTPVVRFLSAQAPSAEWGKFYEVYVDGEVVGYVGTQLVTFERSMLGSRIVTKRTRSPRWFVQSLVSSTSQSRVWRTSKIWDETRKEAVRRLMIDSERWSRFIVTQAVENSRNFHKSEHP